MIKKFGGSGEQNGRAKLTAKDVKIVREMEGAESDIGQIFGVSRHTIHSIRLGRRWGKRKPARGKK